MDRSQVEFVLEDARRSKLSVRECTDNLLVALELLEFRNYLNQSDTAEKLEKAVQIFQKQISAHVAALTTNQKSGEGSTQIPSSCRTEPANEDTGTSGEVSDPKISTEAEIDEKPKIEKAEILQNWKCSGCEKIYRFGKSENAVQNCCPGSEMELVIEEKVKPKRSRKKKKVVKKVAVVTETPGETPPVEETKSPVEETKSPVEETKTPVEETKTEDKEERNEELKTMLGEALAPDEMMYPKLPPGTEAENTLHIQCDYFGCDQCQSEKLILRLDPNVTGPTGKVAVSYRCLSCNNLAAFSLSVDETKVIVADSAKTDYAKLELAKPESEEKPKKKTRKKKAKKVEDEELQPVENDLESAAIKPSEEADKILAEAMAFKSETIGGDVIRNELESMVSAYTKDKLIHEWERLTGRAYDPAVSDDELKISVVDSLSGAVGAA